MNTDKRDAVGFSRELRCCLRQAPEFWTTILGKFLKPTNPMDGHKEAQEGTKRGSTLFALQYAQILERREDFGSAALVEDPAAAAEPRREPKDSPNSPDIRTRKPKLNRERTRLGPPPRQSGFGHAGGCCFPRPRGKPSRCARVQNIETCRERNPAGREARPATPEGGCAPQLLFSGSMTRTQVKSTP
jgi:hypothetical protein